MLSDLISSELPYLRRYARGLMGEQQNGDEAVEDMIESLIFRISVAPDLKFQKADLFAELDKSISKRVSTLTDETGIAKILNAMTTLQRRSLLLTVVEGFSVQEAARILSVGVPDVEEMLRTAESAIANEVSTSVLIIEDDPHMAELLSVLVEQTGHWVAGVAHTRDEAVKLAGEQSFGLILSDIELGEEVCGKMAVTTIRETLGYDVPTIYITAHPERLEDAGSAGQDGLVPKPFDIWRVREAVNRAINVHMSIFA